MNYLNFGPEQFFGLIIVMPIAILLIQIFIEGVGWIGRDNFFISRDRFGF